METFEFDAMMPRDGVIHLPAEIAQRVSVGERVHVIIEPVTQDAEAVRRGIASTLGARQDDTSIKDVFGEMDRDRRNERGT